MAPAAPEERRRAPSALVAGTGPTSTADSNAVVADAVGTWCFRAVYIPNTGNYTGSSDSSPGECFTVKDRRGTSEQTWFPNDSATFTSTGGTALKGSLKFTLYDSADCTGTILRTAQTFAIDGASPVTRSTTNTTVLGDHVQDGVVEDHLHQRQPARGRQHAL